MLDISPDKLNFYGSEMTGSNPTRVSATYVSGRLLQTMQARTAYTRIVIAIITTVSNR